MTNFRIRHDDEGLSMVELIVVMVVSAIFLALLAALFGNSLSTQQRATERDAVTAQVNAATAAITQSVRASTTFNVSVGGARVDVKMLKADGTTWECRAWQVLGGELRYSAGTTARPAASTAWKSLASGIEGDLAGGAAFSAASKKLSLAFIATQGDTVVTVTDGAFAQAVKTGGPTCW